MNDDWKAVMLFVISLSCGAFSGSASAATDDKVVSISAEVTNGTCQISASPAVLEFAPAYEGKLTTSGTTTQVLPVALTVTQCTGLGGGNRQASVEVSGEMASFDSSLFSDTTSTAGGVGIMLRKGHYTGALNQFYDPNSPDVLKSGDVSAVVSVHPGEMPPDNTVMDFSVGLTNGNMSEPVKAGDMVSTLHFTFLYK